MRFLNFCFVIVLSFKLHAQELFFSQPPGFQNLPSLETYHILQDHKGFLWISTDAGICRYDGKELKVFTSQNGIPENVVFKIYEDHKGRIWFTTLSGYFFYYENGTFCSIEANENLKKLCGQFPVNSFFVGKNDTLFGVFYGGRAHNPRGLFKIPPQNNYKNILIDSTHFSTCHAFLITNELKPTEYIRGVGKFKITSNSAIFEYNKVQFNFPITKEDLRGIATLCEVDRHGNMYLILQKKLLKINKKGIIREQFTFPDVILSCYVDQDNDLWVATNKGGYLFKNSNLHSLPIHFLTEMRVSTIFVDREGTVWVAALEKGIFQSMSKQFLFLNLNDIKPVYLQSDSSRLNITYSSKIISLFKNDSISTNPQFKENIAKGYLRCSYIDDQYLYIGTILEFWVWNRKDLNTPVFFSKNKFNTTEIIRIGKDSMLFFGPATLMTSYNNNVKSTFNPFPLRSIFQLKNKKVLVSSRNNNGVYELKNNEFIPYLPQLLQLKTRINCMIEDASGNLWFATNEQGLYCYDSKQQLHRYTTANKLSSNKINALTIDSKNNLWLGSYNGLTKISYTPDLQKINVLNYNKSHGIPNLQIERLSSFNGKIACISKSIFFYFNEDALQRNEVAPLNYMESVFINDVSYNTTDTPVLSHDQNNIRVQASLLTFKNTENRKFLYKLIGYDDNWHSSATGEIQYTNLPHGHYILTIYGLNNDNIKSNRPASFSFTIKKPFWLTWWFILLEIILFSVIFYFVIRFWKNKIQKKAHDQALINQKIAEFKMTALRSQMNPHFVFNAISSIQHYILKQDTFKSYNYLAKFSLLIRTILDNSKEEYILLSQEINTLKLYIELEQIRFKQPFEFILEVDKALEMDTYIPTMLIQPYVENSIWHGLMPKKTNCMLEVFFKKKETHIFVTIKDNGVGRNHIGKKNSLHMSKGMSITEQRIKELENTNEKKFNVTILDLTDEKGNSTGTEVQIIIPFDL